MDKFEPNDLKKMKVVDLRKFVSQNNIFKGGLCSMKKSDILDGIYRSDFWQNQLSNMQKEQIENRLKQLQDKLITEQHPVEQHPVETVEQQPQEQQPQEQQPQEQQPQEQQPQEQQPQEQKDIDIKKLIDDALQQQREEIFKRLFE
jgi:hypothetical protein